MSASLGAGGRLPQALARALFESLRRALFSPSPLLDLAVLRIATVAFQLGQLFGPLGPARLQAISVRPDSEWQPLPIVRLTLSAFGIEGCPSSEWLLDAHTLGIGAGLCALIGLATPICLPVFALVNLLLQGLVYSFGEVHHPEALLCIALVALSLSPAGAALSIDAARPGGRPRERMSDYARWPRKLVQVLLALAYLSAAASKLATSGLDWANGFTLQYVLAEKGTETGRPLGLWLSRQHGLAVFLSWAALLYESTFWCAVLWPRLRRPILAVGVLQHALIDLTMGASFFQFVVLFSAFAPWRVSARPWPPTREHSRAGRVHGWRHARARPRQP